MTVKITTRIRVSMLIHQVERRLGVLLIAIGNWFIRGCKLEQEYQKRSDGIIDGMICGPSYSIFEDMVRELAYVPDTDRLARQLRWVGEDAYKLADEVELYAGLPFEDWVKFVPGGVGAQPE